MQEFINAVQPTNTPSNGVDIAKTIAIAEASKVDQEINRKVLATINNIQTGFQKSQELLKIEELTKQQE